MKTLRMFVPSPDDVPSRRTIIGQNLPRVILILIICMVISLCIAVLQVHPIIYDFTGAACEFLFYLATFTFPVVIPRFIRDKKISELGIKMADLYYAILLSSIALSIIILKIQNSLTFNRAERIISALDSCHLATGAYPASLAELSPAYLPVIPSTALGWGGMKFGYSSSKNSYRLLVPSTAMMCWFYDSSRKKWDLRD